MKKNSAYTLIELLVSLAIAMLVILAIGAVTNIGTSLNINVMREAALFNDLSQSFKFMQNRAHTSTHLTVKSSPSSPWVSNPNSEMIINDKQAFGLYQNGSLIDFVYDADINDPTNPLTTFLSIDPSKPNGCGTSPLPPCNSINLFFTEVVMDGHTKAVTASLYGAKDKIPFSIIYTITRRLP